MMAASSLSPKEKEETLNPTTLRALQFSRRFRLGTCAHAFRILSSDTLKASAAVCNDKPNSGPGVVTNFGMI